MIDKIRLKLAGKLPEEYHRNYGLSIGLDGQLCGFLNLKFEEIESRVGQGGTDEEIVEWIFARGLRPNRTQAFVWNEHSRKLGWNDRISSYNQAVKKEWGREDLPHCTSFDLIEISEQRTPPPSRT
jgi:hypothetical protein